MNVFIVGIAGQTGLRLARLLKSRGDEVDGLYRRPVQSQMLSAIGITGTLGDLVQIAGKHAESEAKYDEAAKAAGITLQKKQQ